MGGDDYDFCDYCHEEIEGTFRLRAVGFVEEYNAPLVKVWCGECEVPDDIDLEAHEALWRALAQQATEDA